MSEARKSVLITRKVFFCAAHRYHNPAWSDEKNVAVFGACNNPHGHGHNYVLEVTVRGPVDPDTGMVLNLRQIDEILREEVVSRFDHRHINLDVAEFRDVVPTTENLVLHIWDLVSPHFAEEGTTLHRVRLYESPELYAEYRGEEADG